MKLNTKTGWLAALAVLAAAAIVLLCSFGFLGGRLYSLGSQKLDLRGRQLEGIRGLSRFSRLKALDIRGCGITRQELEQLRIQLPDCKILWQLDFQGKTFDPDLREIRVKDLDKEAVAALGDFKDLETVRVSSIRDYEALGTLLQRDCQVEYRVDLGEKTWPRDAETAFSLNGTGDQLRSRLPYLKELKRLHLLGTLPSMEELLALQAEFPEITFSWAVSLGRLRAEGSDSSLDLGQADLEGPEEFLALRAYFPALKTVDLRGAGFTNAEILGLMAKEPELAYQWDLGLGSARIDALAETAQLEGLADYSLEDLRQLLPSLPKLRKLVLLDSGFESADLDALDREFPEVRIVWNVDIGGVNLRTDALYYAPNKFNNVRCYDEDMEPIRYCRDLICVDVGHRQVTHCEWVRFMPHLKYLILADTGIRDLTPVGNLKELVFLEVFLTNVKDLSPLQGCTALEDLNISYIQCKDPEPIIAMPWLKRLWWGGSPMPMYTLQQKLPDTRVECNAGSSTGKDWRQGQHYFDMRDLIGMEYMLG